MSHFQGEQLREEMDWNTFLASGGNQAFNFIPREFPAANSTPYQNCSENWPYYAINQNYVSDPSVQQMVAAIPDTVTQYGPTFSQPAQVHSGDQSSKYPLNVACENYSIQTDAMAIASMSSLTPTAGEFIPRSRNVDVSHLVSQQPTSTVPNEPAKITNSQQVNKPVCIERNKQLARRFNPSESRFYSSKNALQVQDTSSRKNIKSSQPNSNQNSRLSSAEDSKNKDRQRLLAQAAAFYSSPASDNGNSDTGSANLVQKPSEVQFSNDSQEHHIRETNNRGRGQNQSGTRNDVKPKTFINSRYNGRSYDISSGARGFSSQSDSPTYNSRGRKYITPNNEAVSENEHYTNYLSKSESNSCGSNFGSSRYSKERNTFSPRVSDSNSGRSNTSYPVTRVKSFTGDAIKIERSGEEEVSQRERLSEQLLRGALECLVCCDRVRQHDATWSCSNCYHVLHLRCIKKWAKSSKADAGWRCPACQNVTQELPHEYRCFCKKMRDPEWNRQDVPHSCGEMCGLTRPRTGDHSHPCVHKCTLLCHPGPCPPCVARVNRACGCGKSCQMVTCGSGQPLLCPATCGKPLNCQVHTCTESCHMGACGDCQQIVKQVCFCGKLEKETPCSPESLRALLFACGEPCRKDLDCGHHQCMLLCHEGLCPPCELTPNKVTHCPCGKMLLTADNPRTSCLDPVPTCEQPCEKRLPCGQPGNNHLCESACHSGPCPTCSKTTFVKCRCGHMDKELECAALTTKADDARCEKRCTKKRSCGRHKCNQMCCIDLDHVCPLPCNRMLSCGQHRCEEPCHRGNCMPCYRTSFEELYCECGASVIYPPVACGTRRPKCNKPCSRQHSCEHPALHQCHSEPSCPPCTVLMQKYCYGKHELRKAVPCHQMEFSCGMPCGRPLICGRHTCILPCHNGDCLRPGQVCTQPCKLIRTPCGHPCAAPCHEGMCPDTLCKETVRVTCECGHRSTTRPCCDQAKEYQRVLTALLASKMHDVQLGHSVDTDDLGGFSSTRALNLKTLECNDECKIIERNRRLCIGLQIRNPDLSGKLQPRYSEFLRQWGKKDPHFVNMVHDKLMELVQLAKQSKQKSRSYSFSSMNREKRHFIHEYCEHFGCESQAYDPEPNRNVVATAQRDKAWLPSMSLMEVLQRESGQRKVPRPVTARAVDNKMREDSLPGARQQTQSLPKPKSEKSEKEEPPEIDYFEMTS